MPLNRISGPTKKKNLEHSFSDLSQFDIDSGDPLTTAPARQKGLRADFVHLHGIGLYSKTPKVDLQPILQQEAEGVRSCSIQRSMSSAGFAPGSVENATNGTKTIVVVPSMDLDAKELTRMSHCIEYYEERQLYYLLLATDPSFHIIYLASNHVDERVIGYYLSLCQDNEGDREHRRLDRFHDMRDKLSRIFVLDVPSKQYTPLSEAILQCGNLVKFVRSLIHRRKTPLPTDSAGLCVFTGSSSADEISRELGVELLQASGDHLHFGTKQGSREIFAACGIPHPAGTPSEEDDDLLTYGNMHGEEEAHWADDRRYIRSSRSLAIGISRQILLHGVRSKYWMIKLNQGFSGKGNAFINLQRFQDRRYPSSKDIEKDIIQMAATIEKEFETMRFEDSSQTWHGEGQHAGFQKQIARLGVIAEAFIEGEVPTSPSIQAVIEPNADEKSGGRVSIISTHEQILHGQVFNGCINPASEQYRARIMDAGLKIGRLMAARGVRGHFSCDFLATRDPNGPSWQLHAIEINLRQGGTSHCQATMTLLCGGRVRGDGVFRTNNGEARTYVATDCHWLGRGPCGEGRMIDAIESGTDPLARKIRWNRTDRVGVVFHLLKFATVGRVGFTAIGRNLEESQLLFDAAKEFLLQMK